MPKISGSIKPSVTTTEINEAVTPSTSEVTNTKQTSQVTGQSAPRFSDKEIKSRLGELKLGSQALEMQLRSVIDKNQAVTEDQKQQMMSSPPSMQKENLVNTILSNVLETKHSTAKKSIKNVR